MNNMLPMLYETLFGILALFLLTKLLGKTQISQLTAFDFIAAIVLGELVGNALFDKKAGILDIGFVILLWGVVLYAIEIVTQKFKGSRFILEGKPAIIIHKGELIYEEMRKNKIDINEVQQLLRMKDVFALQEVEYAILETNGELSVLKKAPFQTPNKKDLNVAPEEPQIAMPLIIDGEVVKDNLAEANVTEEWLLDELKRQNYDDIRQVFYAEWLEGKKLFVLPYTKIKKKHLKKKYK
ncbi:DUF421 domain-containing protein [Pseudogracilibacillus auburnensis]|uniref:Uncharacterized membrane protein YcaP (DUF421 family) n=1 Tax=Pseudogracilibacillus auburnensis TaxID=1494959 RepID=A0A2V3VYI8_9BACI|nr:DUF421 domain-containing protein [Pseudogracilibacillus auburnensis]MBO1002979.1 DUF421 domain-containing protein [Pseudogracilibacillus auburnensis]PXW87077.1 uncharacterized membrane protein YcaP (DUF421 family) [Pseudogracilibacillus auburnensis]